MIWLILLAGLLLALVTSAPIGVVLALTGIALLHIEVGGASFLAVTAVWNVFTQFTLSAVPVFIIMGEILLASGISKRIYDSMSPLFQRVPGNLLHTNVAVCTVFGSVSGASMSTAAAVGSVAYPELRNRGYDRNLVVATLAAGGTLGLMIPPSLALIIFGATQQVSIGKLFLAGILPGLLIAALMMLLIGVRCKLNPSLTPSSEPVLPWPVRLRRLLGLWPLLTLIGAVLGPIYLGLATPTESAGLGVLCAIIVGFFWGNLTIAKLGRALIDSVLVFGTIGLVILGALILAQAVSILGLPGDLMQLIVSMELSKYHVLIVIVICYLILGCFFDGISLLLMTVPIVFPVLTSLGFDPVWVGIIVTLLIEIGMITPPVGLNLFVLVGITKGEVTLPAASLAALPFWMVMLVAVLILTLFPQIALFLPGLM